MKNTSWINFALTSQTALIGSTIVSFTTPAAVLFAKTTLDPLLKTILAIGSYGISFVIFAALFYLLGQIATNTQINLEEKKIKIRTTVYSWDEVNNITLYRKYNQTRPVYHLVFTISKTGKKGRILLPRPTTQEQKTALLEILDHVLTSDTGRLTDKKYLNYTPQPFTKQFIKNIVNGYDPN